MAFLLFVDVFLVVVKGATDKLVPASMIQNKSVFELYRDVVDTMVSNTGGFAAIFIVIVVPTDFAKSCSSLRAALIVRIRILQSGQQVAPDAIARVMARTLVTNSFLQSGHTKMALLSERAEISLGV